MGPRDHGPPKRGAGYLYLESLIGNPLLRVSEWDHGTTGHQKGGPVTVSKWDHGTTGHQEGGAPRREAGYKNTF